MKLAMVGLGRMGMNMARRFILMGHEVVAYNRTRQKTDEIAKGGAIGTYTLADLTKRVSRFCVKKEFNEIELI